MRGRQAKCESESWRRTSKPWHRELWKERPSWKGLTFSFFSFFFPYFSCDFSIMWVSWINLIISNQMCVYRMKERAKRAGVQRKEEESERKNLQVLLIKNMFYVIIKPVSQLFFFLYICLTFAICVINLFLSEQAGTDRRWTQKSVQGVPGPEELAGSERHQCPAAAKHHHHPYPETHHCPQERGQTFFWNSEVKVLKRGLVFEAWQSCILAAPNVWCTITICTPLYINIYFLIWSFDSVSLINGGVFALNTINYLRKICDLWNMWQDVALCYLYFAISPFDT